MPKSTAPERQIPAISYPPELPVAQLRDELAAAITAHQVVIVAGETGSGKTTQLPKICLELGRGRTQTIGHTQPRRLAARTVAARIAQELQTPLGDLVGYQVRFHDQVSSNTAVKLMTDGILLAELQRDRLLRSYDTLIIDEAHERSLNIDFLLGYIKRILPQRPDLKVIVTSATIDVEGFSKHFSDAPVIEVSGRTFPIETHYIDTGAEREDSGATQVSEVVEDIAAQRYGPRGDVLVFLPGERDIRETAKLLRHRDDVDVLPLYARLTAAEQNRVFDTSSRRAAIRVVLATNVAETSLTVPGIRYVIDTGLARISRYSHRSKMQRLPIEPISRASADQRRGRCGRIGPGICLRLYSESDYDSRIEFTDPEIQRTNLAAVVLQMLSLGLGDIEQFPFLDPPEGRMVRDGFKLLEELGAVTDKGKLTQTGRQLARLPVDPRLGRMVLAAIKTEVVEEILVIASALAVQDPRERPAEKQAQSDQMHARFKHERSDFMQWLNLWGYYEEQRQSLSQNQLRKLCKKEFLSYMRMREWRDVHRQLSIACRALKVRINREMNSETVAQSDYDAVHKALLAGLLSNIAQWHEEREYLGARNRKLQIFPGSGLSRKRPKWLVAGEIVETSRVFARQVAAIDPRWAVDINPGLLKEHIYEPRWQVRRGQVVAYQRLSLYGLVLSDKRSVHYGPQAPEESRSVMIREGLIPGRWQRPPAFLKHNLRLVQQVEELESRTRRRDILVDEQALYDFYAARIPAGVYTASSLLAWLKREPDAAKEIQMTREVLLARDPGEQVTDQFPDSVQHQGMELRLRYQFEPGQAADGVSVIIPVALLNRAPRHLFEWLVPGLLREKCIALVKGLPKEKRKHLVPVPDHVDSALSNIQVENVDLLAVLAKHLSAPGRVNVTREDLANIQLDDYYRMNVRVVDASGALLEQGRDLASLIARFRSDTQEQVQVADKNSPAKDNIQRWDFGDLPKEWRFRQAGLEIVSYPALQARAQSVSIVLCDYPDEARRTHRNGVLQLVQLRNAQSVKYLRKQMLRGNDFSLLLARAQIQRETLLEDLIDAAFIQASSLDESQPYTTSEFDELQRRAGSGVVSHANELENLLKNVLEVLGDIRQTLAAVPARWDDTRQDIRRQLTSLLQQAFLRDTPAIWLGQYPRYLKALRQRLERLSGQYEKDQKYQHMLASLEEPLANALLQRGSLLSDCGDAQTYRWLLEEFRVSLFAQNLSTKVPVSEKRLREKWRAVESWIQLNPS